MSYIHESVSSLSDFITKLDTFLVGTPGWTSDHLVAGKWAIHKSTVYVSARYDTGSPNNLGIYHALGFTGTGTDPGNHTDDSGNGAPSGTDATLAVERYARITNTPLEYWAFEDDTYCHVVVHRSTSPDIWIHFGFGILEKTGNWTGGEYCYGFRYHGGINNSVAILEGSCVLLDGLAKSDGFGGQPNNMEKYAATIHAEGLPNMDGNTKWCVVMGDQAFNDLALDRATEPRNLVQGGFRGGPVARAMGRFSANAESGLMPGYPIECFYRDDVAATETVQYLGRQPDVRGVSTEHYVGGDEITIGSDTWVIFPSSVKWISGTLENTSGYQGIMYRKETT